MKTIDATDVPREHDEFTPDELTRYASYHWLVEGEEPNQTSHVWRSIAGQVDYMGTTDQIANREKPAQQRELRFELGPELSELDVLQHRAA